MRTAVQQHEPADALRREIAATGPISFARFMEVALYLPGFGYYEQSEQTVGRSGDFFTSVSVGSLFGELLAFQFVEWLETIGDRSGKLKIVEAGAHDGQLATDILSWIDRFHPEILTRMEYEILEPSERRREWQRKKLEPFSGRVSWRGSWSEVAPVRGIIFSNELLDAFPVHRFGWDATRKAWFEWGVDWKDDRFCWERCARSEARAPRLPEDLAEHLPDGYIGERSTEAEEWWAAAAGALKCGKLLAIDYGLTDEELFVPERSNGTLRAYRRHRASDDLLAEPGRQDLTAHVQFGALQETGEHIGLRTDRFCRQSEFLVTIAERTWHEDARFGEWTPEKRRQFQTLVHPEHLGRPFRVLVQGRD